MAALGPAVSSLQTSLTLLDSSISILHEGVADFPRLCKVLHTQQHFELVPEARLKAAQQALANEIAPAVEQLLSTAEAHVKQLGRKEQSLRARSELLEGRLASSKQTASTASINSQSVDFRRTFTSGDNKALQLKRLQQKKEQLQYAIERLEMQYKQKERELRRSMAFIKDDPPE